MVSHLNPARARLVLELAEWGDAGSDVFDAA